MTEPTQPTQSCVEPLSRAVALATSFPSALAAPTVTRSPRERSSLRTLRTIAAQRRLPPRARSAGPSAAHRRNTTPRSDCPARAHVWGKQAERSEAVGGSPLGTPETITDGAHNVTHQEHGPFGNWQGSPPSLNGLTSQIGFTGQPEDTDLGLTDMGGRIYDPLAGRFTTPDPIMQAPFGLTQGQNRYAYVFNDPLNNTDPSGFSVVGDLGFAANGVPYSTGPYYDFGADSFAGSGSSSGSGLGGNAAAGLAGAGIAALQDLIMDPGASHAHYSAKVAAPTAAAKSNPNPANRMSARNHAPPRPLKKAAPPAPRESADEWGPNECGADCMGAKNGAQAEKLAGEIIGNNAMKGDPTAAKFYDAAGGVLFQIAIAPIGGVELGAEKLAGEVFEGVAAEGAEAGASETYEILDGVRRAKAAQLTGADTIAAEVEVGGKTVASGQVPIKSLLSPKGVIDTTSTPNALGRWLNTLRQTAGGSPPPAIRITPGANGTPIDLIRIGKP